MATALAQPAPGHPHGFLLHQHHHQPSFKDAAPVQPQSQPVVPKPQPTDPYYGHEETAKICARFIRHVFNCPPDANAPLPLNGKPTESTIALPRFIAYAFHRTRLPQAVAFHSLFLLSRLKSRYPAASCAFGHRLFLTSYMLSSKVICDDTYSNKSWAIVGQGFYDLRDVNLMEREMIHYLSWDLTISGPDLQTFTDRIRGNYRKGVPKARYVVIPDKSREKDSFGKGVIEERMSDPPAKLAPTPSIQLEQPQITPSDPPPSYSASAPPSDEIVSPYSSSSSSTASSRSSSPPSPYLNTPPDEGPRVPSSPGGGKTVPIDFIESKPHTVQVHDIERERERTWGWARGVGW